jgi:hypothetical protein
VFAHKIQKFYDDIQRKCRKKFQRELKRMLGRSARK